MYMPYFFINSSVNGHLFPHLGYCELYCNDHGSATISLRSSFKFFWINDRTLLMRIQNGTAAVEYGMVMTQNIKNKTAI